MLKNMKTQKKKSLVSGLTLTSLVDCFTILVVYLLVATTFGGEEMNVDKNIQLPTAAHSEELKGSPILKVLGSDYIFEDKKINVDQLFTILKESALKNESITIQADKNNDYAKVNPVVLSALQAGFKKVKFAVLHVDEG